DIPTSGPTGTADAPLASASDNPAAPNTGRVLLRRFRFEACFTRDMAKSSHTFGQCLIYRYRTTLVGLGQFLCGTPLGKGSCCQEICRPPFMSHACCHPCRCRMVGNL